MYRSISHGALLRGILAGTIVLAGSSACSRPDRADSGNEPGQPTVSAAPTDTQSTAVTRSADTNITGATAQTAAPSSGQTGTEQGVSGYQPMAQDTTSQNNDTAAQTGTTERTDSVAVGDSAHVGKPGERLEGTRASEQANEDSVINQQADSGRIRPPEDSSEVSGAGAGVGSAEMARDTNVALAQGDSAVQPDTGGNTAVAADTATIAAEVDTSSTIQVAVDTTTADQQTEVGLENQVVDTAAADTAVVVGDSSMAGREGERLEPEVATAEANADTLAAADTGRIRPPEDSSEVLGNVSTEQTGAEPTEVESRDAAEIAAAGVASTGNAVTGANAIAEMTRQGQNCAISDSPEEVRFDMASSPATLNPCGTGTMTLPRIVTGEEK